METKNKIGIVCVLFWGTISLLLARKDKLELTPEEKVIEQAKFIGEIKSELAEGKKKLKPVYTKKFAEKKEVQSKATTFKYTQTIAHLLVTLPKELFPEAKDYKTLIEYYDSLGKNEREKFIDILVERAAIESKKDFISFLWRAASSSEEKKQLKEMEDIPDENFLLNELRLAVKRENEFDDMYVFYCGYSGILEYIFDFISIVESYLFIEKIKKEQSIFADLDMFESINDVLSDKGKAILTGKAFDSLISVYVYSVNIALFGNRNTPYENSFCYFLTNKSIASLNFLTIIKNLCFQIGLDFENNENALSKILKKYSTLHGKIRQFFVKPENVNQLSYISLALGFPYKTFEKLPERYFRDNYSGFPMDFPPKIKSKETSEILSLVRDQPNNEILTKKEKTSNIMGIDLLQARLLANSLVLESLGVRVFYLFAYKEDENNQQKFKNEFEKLIKKMIKRGLEEKIIKKSSIKGKIPLIRLYEPQGGQEQTENQEDIKKLEENIRKLEKQIKDQTEQIQEMLNKQKTEEKKEKIKNLLRIQEEILGLKEKIDALNQAMLEEKKKISNQEKYLERQKNKILMLKEKTPEITDQVNKVLKQQEIILKGKASVNELNEMMQKAISFYSFNQRQNLNQQIENAKEKIKNAKEKIKNILEKEKNQKEIIKKIMHATKRKLMLELVKIKMTETQEKIKKEIEDSQEKIKKREKEIIENIENIKDQQEAIHNILDIAKNEHNLDREKILKKRKLKTANMLKILEETKTKEEEAREKETTEALEARKEWAKEVDVALEERRKKQWQQELEKQQEKQPKKGIKRKNDKDVDFSKKRKKNGDNKNQESLATALTLFKAKLLSLAQSLSTK